MEFNWFAVVVAALVPTLVGFVWYHPKVMGTVWMKAAGLTEDDLKKGNMPMIFGISFVMAFLLATFWSVNVTGPGQEDLKYHTFQHGLVHGLILTITIVLPLVVTNGLFERKSWTYILVNAGYWCLTFCIGLGILSLWR